MDVVALIKTYDPTKIMIGALLLILGQCMAAEDVYAVNAYSSSIMNQQ